MEMTSGFSKILIANRGEVAARVIRACREKDICSVSVYSDVDRNALHARLADEAVHIGGNAALESYLDQQRILDAARTTGVDAIHPGFGFLAESADFAEACEQAGFTFIGPGADVMRLMASKATARQRMEEIGIPVIPGRSDVPQDPDALALAADDIGYPVLIKATAGGGGVGMRVVHSANEFSSALSTVRREARAAFADDHVFVEKYLDDVRHVEVQILGDNAGNVLHCFERECSLQRRRQKIVEEAPSPSLSPELRDAMTKAAVQIGEAVNYVGLGTVEFILCRTSGQFYFLEMNTRLQVEHGITESITGLDLVKLQIDVAAGRELEIGQDEIGMNGHAIECRLYAEDPDAGFAPCTGQIQSLEFAPVDGLRIDAGVEQGDGISPWYDPMIAKLIVHGANRPAATREMTRCLARSWIVGVETNLAFLGELLRRPEYRDNDVSTSFVDTNIEELSSSLSSDELDDIMVIAAVHRARQRRIGEGGGYPPQLEIAVQAAGIDMRIAIVSTGVNQYAVAHSDKRLVVRTSTRSGKANEFRIEIDGRLFRYQLWANDAEAFVKLRGAGVQRVSYPSRFAVGAGRTDAGSYVASMPGVVLDVLVDVGGRVEAGDTLIVMESMKMENRIQAASDGYVSYLGVCKGDSVERNTQLVDVSETPLTSMQADCND